MAFGKTRVSITLLQAGNYIISSSIRLKSANKKILAKNQKGRGFSIAPLLYLKTG